MFKYISILIVLISCGSGSGVESSNNYDTTARTLAEDFVTNVLDANDARERLRGFSIEQLSAKIDNDGNTLGHALANPELLDSNSSLYNLGIEVRKEIMETAIAAGSDFFTTNKMGALPKDVVNIKPVTENRAAHKRSIDELTQTLSDLKVAYDSDKDKSDDEIVSAIFSLDLYTVEDSNTTLDKEEKMVSLLNILKRRGILLTRVVDENGNTPLHILINSTSDNKFDLAKFLTDAGFDIGIRNKAGKSFADLALETGQKDLLYIVADSSNDFASNTFYDLLASKTQVSKDTNQISQNTKLINTMIDNLSKLSVAEISNVLKTRYTATSGNNSVAVSKEHAGRALIHVAVINNDGTAERLIDLAKMTKYDILSDASTLTEDNGALPIHMAAKYGNVTFAKKLFEMQSNLILALDNRGNTAFQVAALNGTLSTEKSIGSTLVKMYQYLSSTSATDSKINVAYSDLNGINSGRTPLMVAITKGSKEVKAVLSAASSVIGSSTLLTEMFSAKDNNSFQAIHFAVTQITSGSETDGSGTGSSEANGSGTGSIGTDGSKDDNSVIPTYNEADNLTILTLLLEKNADIYSTQLNGKDVLSFALAQESGTAIANILRAKPEFFNTANSTILHRAAIASSSDVVSAIVKFINSKKILNGINVVDSNNSTALMIAAINGNVDAAKALKEAGIDLTLKDKDNKSAFDLALANNTLGVQKNNYVMASYVTTDGSLTVEALSNAIASDRADLVKQILTLALAFDLKNNDSEKTFLNSLINPDRDIKPIYVAINHNVSKEVFKALLEQKSDILDTVSNGKDVLEYAIEQGKALSLANMLAVMPIERLAKTYTVKVNSVDVTGNTLLHRAVQLLSADAENAAGIIAAIKGGINTVDAAIDSQGNTALHLSAASGKVLLAKYIGSVAKDMENRDGLIPLHLAIVSNTLNASQPFENKSIYMYSLLGNSFDQLSHRAVTSRMADKESIYANKNSMMLAFNNENAMQTLVDLSAALVGDRTMDLLTAKVNDQNSIMAALSSDLSVNDKLSVVNKLITFAGTNALRLISDTNSLGHNAASIAVINNSSSEIFSLLKSKMNDIYISSINLKKESNDAGVSTFLIDLALQKRDILALFLQSWSDEIGTLGDRQNVVEKTRVNGRNILHRAVVANASSEVIQTILSLLNGEQNSLDNDGKAPIHLAVAMQESERLISLLTTGKVLTTDLDVVDSIKLADRSRKDSDDNTLLHLAILAGKYMDDNFARLYVNSLVNEVNEADDIREGIVALNKEFKTPVHLAIDAVTTAKDASVLSITKLALTDREKEYSFSGTLMPVQQEGSLLNYAIETLKIAAIPVLGTDINKIARVNGKTPLTIALALNNDDILQAVLALGIDPNAGSDTNTLFTAIQNRASDLELTDIIDNMQTSAGQNWNPDAVGVTKSALHVAVEVFKSSSQTVTKEESDSSLIESNRIVDLLKSKGFHLTTTNQFGETPLTTALFQDGRTFDAAFRARFISATTGNTLSNKYVQNMEGKSAIHIALDKGVDLQLDNVDKRFIFTRDGHQETILHYAVKRGYVQAIDDLVVQDSNAVLGNVNMVLNNETPLSLATNALGKEVNDLNQNIFNKLLLLSSGATLFNVSDSDNTNKETIVHRAIDQNASLNILTALLNLNGLDVNYRRGGDNNTILHLAVMKYIDSEASALAKAKSNDLVDAILAKNPNRLILNSNNVTPMYIAWNQDGRRADGFDRFITTGLNGTRTSCWRVVNTLNETPIQYAIDQNSLDSENGMEYLTTLGILNKSGLSENTLANLNSDLESKSIVIKTGNGNFTANVSALAYAVYKRQSSLISLLSTDSIIDNLVNNFTDMNSDSSLNLSNYSGTIIFVSPFSNPVQSWSNANPLLIAILNNDVNSVKAFKELFGERKISSLDNSSNNLLSLLAFNYSSFNIQSLNNNAILELRDMVQTVISIATGFDKIDANGETPLSMAVKNDRNGSSLEVVRALVAISNNEKTLTSGATLFGIANKDDTNRETILHRAIRSGLNFNGASLPVIDELLKLSDLNIDALQTVTGSAKANTALHLAVMEYKDSADTDTKASTLARSNALVDRLMAKGASASILNKDGVSAFCIAFNQADRQSDLARFMPTVGINSLIRSAWNSTGETPIQYAIEQNNPAYLTNLRLTTSDKNERSITSNDISLTPLQYAVKISASEVISLLIRESNLERQFTGTMTINGTTLTNGTAFQIAAKLGSADNIIALRDAGANVTLADNETNALHLAILNDADISVISELANIKTSNAEGSAKIFTNTRDSNGLTPIYLAIRKNSSTIVSALVNAGADASLQYVISGQTDITKKETILQYAIKVASTDIIGSILEIASLDIDFQEGLNGDTALHLAVKEYKDVDNLKVSSLNRSNKIISLILSKKDNLTPGVLTYKDIKNGAGNTPFHIAWRQTDRINDINFALLITDTNRVMPFDNGIVTPIQLAIDSYSATPSYYTKLALSAADKKGNIRINVGTLAVPSYVDLLPLHYAIYQGVSELINKAGLILPPSDDEVGNISNLFTGTLSFIVNNEVKMLSNADSLAIAVYKGDTTTISTLKSAGFNIDPQIISEESDNILHTAIKLNVSTEVITSLMQLANSSELATKVDINGKTALALAVEADNLDYVTALVDYSSGARKFKISNSDQSILQFAIRRGVSKDVLDKILTMTEKTAYRTKDEDLLVLGYQYVNLAQIPESSALHLATAAYDIEMTIDGLLESAEARHTRAKAYLESLFAKIGDSEKALLDENGETALHIVWKQAGRVNDVDFVSFITNDTKNLAFRDGRRPIELAIDVYDTMPEYYTKLAFGNADKALANISINVGTTNTPDYVYLSALQYAIYQGVSSLVTESGLIVKPVADQAGNLSTRFNGSLLLTYTEDLTKKRVATNADALTMALLKSDVDSIRNLIAAGATGSVDINGDNLLHLAVKQNLSAAALTELVKLVNGEVLADSINTDGFTPICLAVDADAADLVAILSTQSLGSRTFAISSSNPDSETLLLRALRTAKSKDTVLPLIDLANLDMDALSFGNTALHYATKIYSQNIGPAELVSKNQLDSDAIVNKIFTKNSYTDLNSDGSTGSDGNTGTDANADGSNETGVNEDANTGTDGNTVGNIGQLKLFTYRDIKDSNNETAFHIAWKQGRVLNPNFAQFVTTDNVKLAFADGELPIKKAIDSGNLAYLTILNLDREAKNRTIGLGGDALNSGSIITYCTGVYFDYLVYAIIRGQTSFIDYLVTEDIRDENGNIIDPSNLNNIYLSYGSNYTLQFDADEGYSNIPLTALAIAVYFMNYDAVDKLITKGATATTAALRTGEDNLLHLAFRKNLNQNIISRLIDVIDNVNSKDSNGHTALYKAVLSNSLDLITKLVNKEGISGADLFDGQSILEFAVSNGAHKDILEALYPLASEVKVLDADKRLNLSNHVGLGSALYLAAKAYETADTYAKTLSGSEKIAADEETVWRKDVVDSLLNIYGLSGYSASDAYPLQYAVQKSAVSLIPHLATGNTANLAGTFTVTQADNSTKILTNPALLEYAAYENNFELWQALVDAGLTIETTLATNIYASVSNITDESEDILSGLSTFIHSTTVSEELYTAVENNVLEDVQRWAPLAKGSTKYKISDDSLKDMTILQFAISNGASKEIVDELLGMTELNDVRVSDDDILDVNYQYTEENISEDSALHLAVKVYDSTADSRDKSDYIVNALLEKGASKSTYNQDGYTPLYLAWEQEGRNIRDAFYTQFLSTNTDMMNAMVKDTHDSILKVVIRSGTMDELNILNSANALDATLSVVEHFSYEAESEDVTLTLLEYAVLNGKAEMISTLAIDSIKNNNFNGKVLVNNNILEDRNALAIAIYKDDSESVKALIAAGITAANLNTTNILHEAVSLDASSSLFAELSNLSNISELADAQDANGYTPLLLAVKRNSDAIISEDASKASSSVNTITSLCSKISETSEVSITSGLTKFGEAGNEMTILQKAIEMNASVAAITPILELTDLDIAFQNSDKSGTALILAVKAYTLDERESTRLRSNELASLILGKLSGSALTDMLNITNSDGETAFHIALAQADRANLIESLITPTNRVQAYDNGSTPFQVAIDSSYASTYLRKLALTDVEKSSTSITISGKDLDNISDISVALTPLQYAVYIGKASLVVDPSNSNGDYSLVVGVTNDITPGNLQVASVGKLKITVNEIPTILENGNALSIALYKQDVDMINALKAVINQAINAGEIFAVTSTSNILIKAFELNASYSVILGLLGLDYLTDLCTTADSQGYTPLYYAVGANNSALVTELIALSNGDNLFNGSNILMYAIEQSVDIELINSILTLTDSGIHTGHVLDINEQQTVTGNTALHLATLAYDRVVNGKDMHDLSNKYVEAIEGIGSLNRTIANAEGKTASFIAYMQSYIDNTTTVYRRDETGFDTKFQALADLNAILTYTVSGVRKMGTLLHYAIDNNLGVNAIESFKTAENVDSFGESINGDRRTPLYAAVIQKENADIVNVLLSTANGKPASSLLTPLKENGTTTTVMELAVNMVLSGAKTNSVLNALSLENNITLSDVTTSRRQLINPVNGFNIAEYLLNTTSNLSNMTNYNIAKAIVFDTAAFGVDTMTKLFTFSNLGDITYLDDRLDSLKLLFFGLQIDWNNMIKYRVTSGSDIHKLPIAQFLDNFSALTFAQKNKIESSDEAHIYGVIEKIMLSAALRNMDSTTSGNTLFHKLAQDKLYITMSDLIDSGNYIDDFNNDTFLNVKLPSFNATFMHLLIDDYVKVKALSGTFSFANEVVLNGQIESALASFANQTGGSLVYNTYNANAQDSGITVSNGSGVNTVFGRTALYRAIQNSRKSVLSEIADLNLSDSATMIFNRVVSAIEDSVAKLKMLGANLVPGVNDVSVLITAADNGWFEVLNDLISITNMGGNTVTNLGLGNLITYTGSTATGYIQTTALHALINYGSKIDPSDTTTFEAYNAAILSFVDTVNTLSGIEYVSVMLGLKVSAYGVPNLIPQALYDILFPVGNVNRNESVSATLNKNSY